MGGSQLGPSRTLDEITLSHRSRALGFRPSRAAKSVGLTASHPSPRGARARSAPLGL